MGFGAVGYIPLSEIVAYSCIYPIGLALHDFTDLIRLIDIAYVKQLNRKNGSDQNPRRRH